MDEQAGTGTTLRDWDGVHWDYRTLSVEHFPQLQEDIDRLDQAGHLSDHPLYRDYLRELRFQLPESFPKAMSVIILAVSTRLARSRFHYQGQVYEVLIPPTYYLERSSQEVMELIRRESLLEQGHRLEQTWNLHVKLLAVRSGLARYGRNNISYVEGMGSLHALRAFLTDAVLPDCWGEIGLLPSCRHCRLCREQCTNGCIREEEFTINAGRCLSLYNEAAWEGDFPTWMDPAIHHTLVGCLRCQTSCPVNRPFLDDIRQLEDIDDEETAAILEGAWDSERVVSAFSKLLQFAPPASLQDLAPFSRNLRTLFASRKAEP